MILGTLCNKKNVYSCIPQLLELFLMARKSMVQWLQFTYIQESEYLTVLLNGEKHASPKENGRNSSGP